MGQRTWSDKRESIFISKKLSTLNMKQSLLYMCFTLHWLIRYIVSRWLSIKKVIDRMKT